MTTHTFTPLREDIFATHDYGKLALAKLHEAKPLPQSFMLYEAGWLENTPPFNTMKLRGACFKPATRGHRKGKHCIFIPGTARDVYLTAAEVLAAEDHLKNYPPFGEQA